MKLNYLDVVVYPNSLLSLISIIPTYKVIL